MKSPSNKSNGNGGRYGVLRGQGMSWTYDTRFGALVEELLTVNLRNLKGDPRCRVVKQGPARTVYNVRFLDGPIHADLFIKHYHLPDLFDKLRFLFRPSKGMVEWEMSHTVSGRGIKCPISVAVAERRVLNYLGANFFVTVTEQHALPLDYFLRKNYIASDAATQARLRTVCLEDFARFIHRIHDKGIMHRDFHPGNILIKRAAEGRATFCLLDLHSLTIRNDALSTEERVGNLAQLNAFFSQQFTRADRYRFFRAYARQSGFNDEETRRLSRMVESRTRQSNRRLWARRDKRSLRNNKYFEKFTAGSVRGHVAKEYAGTPLAAMLRDPERFFHDVEATQEEEEQQQIISSEWDPGLRFAEENDGARIIKDSRSTTLVETNLTIGDHYQYVVVKRFNARRTRSPFKRMFRQSRALRAWRLGHSLLVRGLPTPRPLACVERRRFGMLGESYLVTEKVVNSLNLYQVMRYKLSGALSDAQRDFKQQLTVRAALLVRKLHGMGFAQRDLKAQNVLVQPTGRQSPMMNLYLIDMDGVAFRGHVSSDERARNLARLNASFYDVEDLSMTDRLRFLRSYLTGQELAEGKLRVYWKLIAQYTKEKLTRWERAGKLRGGHLVGAIDETSDVEDEEF